MWKTILGEVIKAVFSLGLSLLKKGKKYHSNGKVPDDTPKDNTQKKQMP